VGQSPVRREVDYHVLAADLRNARPGAVKRISVPYEIEEFKRISGGAFGTGKGPGGEKSWIKRSPLHHRELRHSEKRAYSKY